MSEILKAVQNIKKVPPDEPSDHLIEISTQQSWNKADNQHEKTNPTSVRNSNAAITPEEILESLRSEPDTSSLISLLKSILSAKGTEQGFDIHTPGPTQAQIIQTLVRTILPTFASVLEPKELELIVSCLRCIAGIQALVARLKLQLQPKVQSSKKHAVADLEICISILDLIFKGDEAILTIWTDLEKADIQDIKKDLTWKELVNFVASGRIIAAVAQAEDVICESEERFKPTWLSKGSDYATWLGRNITSLLASVEANEDKSLKSVPAAAAKLLSKSLSLGYSSQLVSALTTSFVDHVLDKDVNTDLFRALFKNLNISSQRQFLEHILRWLSAGTEVDDQLQGEQSEKSTSEVSAIAAILHVVIGNESSNTGLLSAFLADPAISSALTSDMRRAMIAMLSEEAPDEVEALLERVIAQFSNRLFIDHSPLIQQESLAQTLLLAAGYVHRKTPMAVLMTARSSGHMQGVSNRLDSSNQRARWLGMVVGVAISSLVDKAGSRMNFGTDELNTKEAKWYQQLVATSDKRGSIAQFRSHLRSQSKIVRSSKIATKSSKTEEMPIINGKRVFGPPRPPVPAQTEIIGDRVTEVFDEPEEDAGPVLKPYAKPDSDPEDSDEDATLVNRNKPKAPVYIRDLMRYLADDKDYVRFQLGIQHAAKLIRRKANFGGEVKDHAHELATMLCGLQDPFNIDNFDELRLQALIAVLLSDVDNLAPWFSRQAFAGDYSLSQRCIMLSTLGLGGRELAGIADDALLNPALLEDNKSSFPTKRLPSHLDKIYNPSVSPVRALEAASTSTSHQLMRPLALEAASTSTSFLNPLKTRTSSSLRRPGTETGGTTILNRTTRKPPPNLLSPLLSQKFFSPLLTRYDQDLSSYGSTSIFASHPFIPLITLIKTLALLLHASGPATSDLQDVTGVFWDFLLTLRTRSAEDIGVMEAVLFGLLTVLEVNSEDGVVGGMRRMIVMDTGRDGMFGRVMETREWVGFVFERMDSGRGAGAGGGLRLSNDEDGEKRGEKNEEVKVRSLAAGVLVRIGEILEARQEQFMGGGGSGF